MTTRCEVDEVWATYQESKNIAQIAPKPGLYSECSENIENCADLAEDLHTKRGLSIVLQRVLGL
jgi:hypothetical protein